MHGKTISSEAASLHMRFHFSVALFYQNFSKLTICGQKALKPAWQKHSNKYRNYKEVFVISKFTSSGASPAKLFSLFLESNH